MSDPLTRSISQTDWVVERMVSILLVFVWLVVVTWCSIRIWRYLGCVYDSVCDKRTSRKRRK